MIPFEDVHETRGRNSDSSFGELSVSAGADLQRRRRRLLYRVHAKLRLLERRIRHFSGSLPQYAGALHHPVQRQG
jgi:hypothetical protein